MVKKFHSQYYVNGSECDLTGKARETQIKVFWYLFTLFTLFVIIIIETVLWVSLPYLRIQFACFFSSKNC